MAKESSENRIKNLYCIEYPGNVKDENRMIETLGGLNTISNAFSTPNRKLECKFRPEDKFCKGIVGEKNKSIGFLLKVVKKSNDGENNLTTSLVGRVQQAFRFTGLNDFQYLPFENDSEGKLVSLHDKIIPNSVINESWFSESIPRFLPPATFSRMDTPQEYLSKKTTDIGSSVIGRTRDRRSNHVIFVSHDLQEIPESPNPNTLRYIKLKLVNDEQILKMKELFEQRPVWTRNALCCVTKFSVVQLKYLLSISAYHFTSGPFRITWVRFGYDPRKDINARKYQIIDYRIRGNVQTMLQERQPEKFKRGRTKLSVSNSECEDSNSDEQTDDNLYVFKPGYLPPQKQMFYQICDIQLPEIQKKLDAYSKEVSYDNKSGWISEEFLDETRKIIDKYVLETIKTIDVSKVDDNREHGGTEKNNSEEFQEDEEMEEEEDEEEFFSEEEAELSIDIDIDSCKS